MRSVRRLLAGLLLGLACLALAGPSSAHALLAGSIPSAGAQLLTPPSAVEMWFSEPLEAEFSTARILDGLGRELPSGPSAVDPNDPTHLTLPLAELEPDVYTVDWQTLSQVDGHEWRGSFTFTVLFPDGSTPAERISEQAQVRQGLPGALETGTRWLGLMGAMLLVGLPVFGGAAVVRASEAGSLSTSRFRQLWSVQLERLAILATALLLIGTWTELALQASDLGRVSLLPRLLFNTRTGALALARQAAALTALVIWASRRMHESSPVRQQVLSLAAFLALVVAAGLLVAVGGQGQLWIAAFGILSGLAALMLEFGPEPSEDAEHRGGSYVPGWIAGLAAAFTYSLGSHAAASAPSSWAVGADFLHLAAAAVWFSGLLALAGLALAMRGPAEVETRVAFSRTTLRFSWIASLALYWLVLSGILSAAVELRGLSSLWQTSYGLVLAVKLGLFVLVSAIAFLNNRTIHRRLASLTDESGLSRFTHRVAAETVVVCLLMVVVAVLVQTPPPASAPSGDLDRPNGQPFSALIDTGTLSFHFSVIPDHVGENDITVHLYTPDASPVGEVQLVRLTLQPPQADLGAATLDLAPQEFDTYAAENVYLSREGTWQASVYVRRTGVDDVLAQTEFPVRSADLTGSEGPDRGSPLPGLPAGYLVSAGLASLAVVPWVWRPLFDRLLPGRSDYLRAGSFVMLAAAIIAFGWALAMR